MKHRKMVIRVPERKLKDIMRGEEKRRRLG